MNTNILSYSSVGQMFDMGLTRWVVLCSFLETPGDNPFPSIFQLLEVTFIHWLVVCLIHSSKLAMSVLP